MSDNGKTRDLRLSRAWPILPLALGVLAALALPGLIERDDFYRWVASQPYAGLLGGTCILLGVVISVVWAAIQFAGHYRSVSGTTREILERQQHLNRATINTIDVGVMAVNAEGRLVQINRAMAGLFGIRGKPVLGQASGGIYTVYNADSGEELEFFRTPIARALAGEEVHEAELMFRNNGDEPRIALCSAKPIVSKGGRNLGALMAAQDITEMRRAQQHLERYAETMQRSGADLQKVAFIAAHNLQEPSRGITSYSQLLQMQYREKLDDAANEYIGFIVTEAGRLKSQLADLLKYLETGAELGEPEQVDLDKLLREVRQRLSQQRADAPDYSVATDPLPQVQGYRDLLSTMLLHLLDNAVKFNKSSLPSVHVRCQRGEEENSFRFEDNGIGIAESDAEKVFELFQTVHPIGSYPGTGLGLAICKKIVTLHGGRIWLEGLHAGGTAVCFTLPHDIPTGELE